jgi:hypothetical protein
MTSTMKAVIICVAAVGGTGLVTLVFTMTGVAIGVLSYEPPPERRVEFVMVSSSAPIPSLKPPAPAPPYGGSRTTE